MKTDKITVEPSTFISTGYQNRTEQNRNCIHNIDLNTLGSSSNTSIHTCKNMDKVTIK